ncbi:MAG: hypothetical protein ACREAZ_07960 [Nitrososphaera sp.]
MIKQRDDAGRIRLYAGISLACLLIAFALGLSSQGLVQLGVIEIESGIAALTPFADTLLGLGLFVAASAATKTGIPMKYLIMAGVVAGIGLFYKSAPHEIHIFSGIGLGLDHTAHVGTGAILITIAGAGLAAFAFRPRPILHKSG